MPGAATVRHVVAAAYLGWTLASVAGTAAVLITLLVGFGVEARGVHMQAQPPASPSHLDEPRASRRARSRPGPLVPERDSTRRHLGHSHGPVPHARARNGPGCVGPRLAATSRHPPLRVDTAPRDARLAFPA
jgi:hypothetical protein